MPARRYASNIPWLRYRPPRLPPNVIHKELHLNLESVHGPLRVVLTAPLAGQLVGIIVTCPGIYRCTEGPGCVYNDLASTVPVGGVAVVQIDYRPPGNDLSAAVEDLLELLEHLASGNLLQASLPVVLVGWSMGGAAVIEAAHRYASMHVVRGLVGLAAQTAGAHNVRNLKIPMLFIHGRDDDILPSRCSKQLGAMSSAIANTEVLLIDDANHRLEVSTVFPAIMRFVKDVFEFSKDREDAVDHVTTKHNQEQEMYELAVGLQVGVPSIGVLEDLDFSEGPDRPRFTLRKTDGTNIRLGPESIRRVSHSSAIGIPERASGIISCIACVASMSICLECLRRKRRKQ